MTLGLSKIRLFPYTIDFLQAALLPPRKHIVPVRRLLVLPALVQVFAAIDAGAQPLQLQHGRRL